MADKHLAFGGAPPDTRARLTHGTGPHELLYVTVLHVSPHCNGTAIMATLTSFQIDQCDRGSRTAREPCTSDRWKLLSQYRDDQHVDAHHQGTKQQRPSSTKTLGQEYDEEATSNDLNQTEEPTDQKSIISRADSFKDLRCDCLLVSDQRRIVGDESLQYAREVFPVICTPGKVVSAAMRHVILYKTHQSVELW